MKAHFCLRDLIKNLLLHVVHAFTVGFGEPRKTARFVVRICLALYTLGHMAGAIAHDCSYGKSI
jgi:hypothetical protein